MGNGEGMTDAVGRAAAASWGKRRVAADRGREGRGALIAPLLFKKINSYFAEC